MIFSLIWGGGESVTINTKYRNDFRLWEDWYDKYGQYDCPNEINKFWQYMMDSFVKADGIYLGSVFDGQYENIIGATCPYKTFRFSTEYSCSGTQHGNSIINNDSGIEDYNITIKNAADNRSGILDVHHSGLSTLKHIKYTIYSKDDDGNDYPLNPISMYKDIDTIEINIIDVPKEKDINSDRTIGRCIEIRNAIKINNYIYNLNYLRKYSLYNNYNDTGNLKIVEYMLSNDTYDSSLKIDSTFNIYLNIDECENDTYLSFCCVGNLNGYRLLCASNSKNVFKFNHIDLYLNIKNANKFTFTDNYINSYTSFCDSYDIYIDLKNIKDPYVNSGFNAKSIHLSNVPSSLQSRFTAACFDIINVIE